MYCKWFLIEDSGYSRLMDLLVWPFTKPHGVLSGISSCESPKDLISNFAASRATSSESNVIIETVKSAEDGSADIVLRLYEAKRAAVRCSLTTTLPVVSACTSDMLETVVHEELPVTDGTMSLDFGPFEVKTVRLRV